MFKNSAYDEKVRGACMTGSPLCWLFCGFVPAAADWCPGL